MHGHLARTALSFAMVVGFLCADWLGVATPTAAQEMPPISTVKVNGTQLAYVEQGQGTPVVFVHGTLTDYRLWTSQLEPFAQAGYRAITYSRRYHYPNTTLGPGGDGSDYSFTQHAEDLAAMIQQLGLGPAHIVGHSTGAITALLLAREHPELVRTLVLGEPGLRSLLAGNPKDQALVEEEMTTTIQPAEEALARDDLKGGARMFIDGRNATPGFFDQLPPPAQARALDNSPALKAELVLGPGLPSFTCADAQKVQAPSLLISGERSLRFFHRITEILTACLPNAEAATIPAAAHGGIFSANPEAANAEVLPFLASQAGSAAEGPDSTPIVSASIVAPVLLGRIRKLAGWSIRPRRGRRERPYPLAEPLRRQATAGRLWAYSTVKSPTIPFNMVSVVCVGDFDHRIYPIGMAIAREHWSVQIGDNAEGSETRDAIRAPVPARRR